MEKVAKVEKVEKAEGAVERILSKLVGTDLSTEELEQVSGGWRECPYVTEYSGCD
jgi:hypothetical protein